jgi:hypothetical protein
MGVDRAIDCRDQKVHLPRAWNAQQYVAWFDLPVAYNREVAAIKKGRYPSQIIPPQRIIAGNIKLLTRTRQRETDEADAIDPGFCISPVQLERAADQRPRRRRNLRTRVNWHRDNGSKDHCPADRVRREN